MWGTETMQLLHAVTAESDVITDAVAF
jgi:hypothetical protein